MKETVYTPDAHLGFLPDHGLVLVGNGPLTGRLQEMASGLGLGARVRFPGRIGRSETIADGVDGPLVEPDDVDALEGAMVTLLDDPAAGRELGREAVLRARCFGTEDNGRAYDGLFDDLVH